MSKKDNSAIDTATQSTVKKKVHLILQGKGGVGKSLIAVLLAQYNQDKGNHVICIDTDPSNKTLAGYRALETVEIDLLVNKTDGDQKEQYIDNRLFDSIVEIIANNPDSDIIIDNGASSFFALCHYLNISGVMELLTEELEREVIIHTVIAGAGNLHDTVKGFDAIVSQFPKQNFIVWLNEYFGEIKDGSLSFHEFEVYKKHYKSITAFLTLPTYAPNLHGLDFSLMLKNKMLFSEAINDPSTPIVIKSRLKKIQKDYYTLLSAIPMMS